MHRKSRVLLIFFMIVGLAASAAPVSMAMMQQTNGWHMGTGWQQTSFSANGVVTAIDPNALTMTVLLNGTSRLLSSYYGQPFKFALNTNTQVAVMVNGGMGYNGMMVNPGMTNGGMMGGGMMGNSSGSGNSQMSHNLGGSLTLADVEVNDNIQLLGYQDTTTGNFVITWILVWLY